MIHIPYTRTTTNKTTMHYRRNMQRKSSGSSLATRSKNFTRKEQRQVSRAPPRMQNENTTDGWSRAMCSICNSNDLISSRASWLYSSGPSRSPCNSSLCPLHFLDYGRCKLLRVASSNFVLTLNHLSRCSVACLTTIVHNEPSEPRYTLVGMHG